MPVPVNNPVRDTAVSAVVSLGGFGTSWFADTLPILQWFAAFIAIVAGTLSVVIAVKTIISWFRRR